MEIEVCFMAKELEVEKLLKIGELASLLGCGRRTILGWQKRYEDFPSIKIGPKLRRYELTEVLWWTDQFGV